MPAALAGIWLSRAVAAGHKLLATDIDAAALGAKGNGSVGGHHRWRTCALDVRDANAWQAVIDRAVRSFGRLDVLLNVAGVIQPGYVHDISPETMLLHLDVNAGGHAGDTNGGPADGAARERAYR